MRSGQLLLGASAVNTESLTPAERAEVIRRTNEETGCCARGTDLRALEIAINGHCIGARWFDVARRHAAEIIAARTPALDLEPIRARLRAATPGEWIVLPKNGDKDWPKLVRPLPPVGDGIPDYEHVSDLDDCVTPGNLAFIASAPTDIAALLAEVERLRNDH